MIAQRPNEHDGFSAAQLLAVDDVAKALKVSVRQVHRMNRAELIPSPLRIGGCVRWRENEISEWMNCGAPCRAEWEKRIQERGSVNHVS